MDAGLLIARLMVGLALSAHGAQKLFGWFGGHGLRGTAGYFEGLGFRPGVLFALAAGVGEAAGGLLTVAGLLGPVGPALIILVMLVAIFAVHWPNGFFASSNGIELPFAYLAAALALAHAGPGAYSLDWLWGLSIFSPSTAWPIIALAVGLGLVTIVLRRSAPAPARTHA